MGKEQAKFYRSGTLRKTHIEITSWKVRAYDSYSRVEKYRKTNE